MQLKWFFDLEASRRLVKYFKVGLESKEMKNLSALGPKNRCKPETVRRIKYLGKRFSKIVDRIDPVSGQDRLAEESLKYSEGRATGKDEYEATRHLF